MLLDKLTSMKNHLKKKDRQKVYHSTKVLHQDTCYVLTNLYPIAGGFSHAPDELTYGVDMQRIRWCGILQVRSINFSTQRKPKDFFECV